jgi:hypothetical protein
MRGRFTIASANRPHAGFVDERGRGAQARRDGPSRAIQACCHVFLGCGLLGLRLWKVRCQRRGGGSRQASRRQGWSRNPRLCLTGRAHVLLAVCARPAAGKPGVGGGSSWVTNRGWIAGGEWGLGQRAAGGRYFRIFSIESCCGGGDGWSKVGGVGLRL